MNGFFGLSERGTGLRTEVVAGLTTFMTMAYIVFVNPAILASEGTGLSASGVVFATCVAAAAASIAMGVAANFPLALAPGLGLNAVVTYTLIIGLGLEWQTAMAAVIVEGLLITVLVLTNLREAVLNAVPLSLKFAIAVGIGLFIAFVGLQNSGVVVADETNYLALGDLTSAPVLLAVFGLAATLALVARGVRGGLLIGIVLTGVVGMILGIVPVPGQVVDFSFDTSTVGGGVLAIPEVLTRFALIPVIFALFMTDFFDTMGTMIAVAQEGKLLDEEGRVPRTKRILLVDSLAAAGGGAMGASSVTAYVESGSGVAEGGRTGLSSVVVGILFLLALPFAPLIAVFGGAVPATGPSGGELMVSPVTAPALVVVGFLMMTSVRFIPWDRFDEAIPAFLTILTLPLTFNIAYGIGFGFISYVLIKVSRGRPGEVHPLLYGVATLFVLAFLEPALRGALA